MSQDVNILVETFGELTWELPLVKIAGDRADKDVADIPSYKRLNSVGKEMVRDAARHAFVVGYVTRLVLNPFQEVAQEYMEMIVTWMSHHHFSSFQDPQGRILEIARMWLYQQHFEEPWKKEWYSLQCIAGGPYPFRFDGIAYAYGPKV